MCIKLGFIKSGGPGLGYKSWKLCPFWVKLINTGGNIWFKSCCIMTTPLKLALNMEVPVPSNNNIWPRFRPSDLMVLNCKGRLGGQRTPSVMDMVMHTPPI